MQALSSDVRSQEQHHPFSFFWNSDATHNRTCARNHTFAQVPDMFLAWRMEHPHQPNNTWGCDNWTTTTHFSHIVPTKRNIPYQTWNKEIYSINPLSNFKFPKKLWDVGVPKSRPSGRRSLLHVAAVPRPRWKTALPATVSCERCTLSCKAGPCTLYPHASVS